MPNLAPWEIEENERWRCDGSEKPEDFADTVSFLSEQTSRREVSDLSRFERSAGGAESVEKLSQFGIRAPEQSIGINPQTAEELKRMGAFDSYAKYHRQVLAACAQMREHLKKLDAALFEDCELESLPERYEDIARELEENWKQRKWSAEAVRRGIFLATELIKAFPVYRFFVPLKTPLRLVECMANKLDASQVSLVLDKLNRLPSAPYSEPSFLGMRCLACDRLLSLYLRTGEYDKAIDVCDCGHTLENADHRSKNRFLRRKKAVIELIRKKGSARDKTKNTLSFNYERQFRKSAHDFSNATL